MTAKGKYPWIVIKDDAHAHCLRCGDKLDLNLTNGQRVEVFLGMNQGFIAAHKGCPENAAPNPPAPPEPTRCPDTKDMFT